MEEIEISASWENAADQMICHGWRKILLLGAVDSGKSTFCRFLSQRLLQSGANVAILDADIGQKDIGPPASITLGYPESAGKPGDAKPLAFYFVGAVNPVRHLLPMVVGTKILLEAARASFVIINTTGLIHGIGRVLKGYKIEIVQPDLIVAIQTGSELHSLLRSCRNQRALPVNRSPKAMAKNAEQRKLARQLAFFNYFKEADEIELDCRKLIFQRSLLFNGAVFNDPRFLYSEATSEGILAVGSDNVGRRDDLQVLKPGFEKNLLCGLADRKGRGRGLAIIKRIDFKKQTILLTTPVLPDFIKVIQPGDLYVNRDGIELYRKRPGAF
ncbi:MAG: Clp1/GlmU family protein [Desulforhabdus sp.]|jgi:polynucleotide 5'-hydroxyl-kinase GRC3/NOL9|nr:Clp1/GlmU family protein [Desulforhabdus sp.]